MYTYLPHLQSQHTKYWVGHVDQQLKTKLTIYFHADPKQGQELVDFGQFLQQHPAERDYTITSTDTDNQAFEELKKFAEDHQLDLINENLEAKTAELSGTLEALGKAFHIYFSNYVSDDGQTHLSYDGHIKIPTVLASYVLNIGNLQQGLVTGKRTKIKVEPKEVAEATESKNENEPNELKAKSLLGFGPKDIELAYNFPAGDAEGECIGLIELGGTFHQSDIETYCTTHQVPIPEIVIVGTAPTVAPSSQAIDDLEVTLDIEIVAGLAPKAKIVIYYAKTIEESIHLAINDDENKPSVLSVSWAQAEVTMSSAQLQQLNTLALQAAKKGITIVAASGDYGAYNKKKFLNTMSPASHPVVLGCGGTTLTTNGGQKELVWGLYTKSGQFTGSGGGYSYVYSMPKYQQQAITNYKKQHQTLFGNTGRSVPDVSANSAIETAYNIVINGQQGPYGGGTSASTPVWAAMIARLNKKLGYRLGYINAYFYKLEGSTAFNPVPAGNNGYYSGAFGWSPAAGLGSPNGEVLAKAIESLQTV